MKKIQFFYFLVVKSISRYVRRFFSFKKHSSHSSNFSLPHPLGLKKHAGFKFFSYDNKYLYISLVTILVAVLIWSLTPFLSRKEVVSEGMIGVYTFNNLPPHITHLLSQPLVVLDKTGTSQPNLVSSWDTSDDVTTYTFHLKDNLFWNDGKKVVSSDVSFSLPDVEVNYPDAQTIQFKLADSFSPFPSLLTTPIFKQKTLVGIGKYTVSDYSLNGSFITKLTLKPVSQKELPDITIRFYPDEKTAKIAFELGEIDGILGVNEVDGSQDPKAVEVQKITNYNKLTAIFYNIDDPILSDENLRKTLTFATPVIQGEEVAKSSIPPFMWAFNSELPLNLNNQESAKKYFNKAEDNKTGMITLTTTPGLASVGKQVITAWKQAGIDSILRIESGVPQNFQALLITEPIPQDPDQYSLWHSTQSKTNLGKYPFAARIDKDLEDGRRSKDVKVRTEKYFDFQKVLSDHNPATFLYFPKYTVMYRKNASAKIQKVLPLQIPVS